MNGSTHVQAIDFLTKGVSVSYHIDVMKLSNASEKIQKNTIKRRGFMKNHVFLSTVATLACVAAVSIFLPMKASAAVPTNLVDVAISQIGYMEKASNSNLDSFTANPGSGNYTKYARDLATFYTWNPQGIAWCDTFVDWCFVQAYGVDVTKAITYQTTNPTLTCSSSAQNYISAGCYIPRGQKNPQAGDQVFFYDSNRAINHTGIVVSVDKVNGTVTYIEGNAIDKVCETTKSLSNTSIAGYGRPKFTKVISTSSRQFVSGLYNYCLGRVGSEGEIDSWALGLNNGGSASQVVRGFFDSQEYANKRTNNEVYVDALYLAVLGRGADAGGRNHWLGLLNSGKASRNDVLNGFVGSAEFIGRCRSLGINP